MFNFYTETDEMSFLDKLRGIEEEREDELGLEERLAQIRRKAEANYVEAPVQSFNAEEDFPNTDGIEVEEVEGDIQELTAEFLLANTNMKVEEIDGAVGEQDPNAKTFYDKAKPLDPWSKVRKNSF